MGSLWQIWPVFLGPEGVARIITAAEGARGGTSGHEWTGMRGIGGRHEKMTHERKCCSVLGCINVKYIYFSAGVREGGVLGVMSFCRGYGVCTEGVPRADICVPSHFLHYELDVSKMSCISDGTYLGCIPSQVPKRFTVCVLPLFYSK